MTDEYEDPVENREEASLLSERLDEAQDAMNRLLVAKEKSLRDRFGHNPLLDEMMRERGAAVRCLSHESRETRLLALLVLDAFHSLDAIDLLAQFERMAFDDPAPEVRAVALQFL